MTMAKPHEPAPDSEALVQEFELDASIDQVWRALTEPDLLAAWLEPDKVGAELGGPIDCRQLDAEPGRRVRYAWRGDGEAGPLDTEVTFELSPTEAGGVLLRVIQNGFVPATMTSARPRVVSLAAHRARRRPAPTACLGGLKWVA